MRGRAYRPLVICALVLGATGAISHAGIIPPEEQAARLHRLEFWSQGSGRSWSPEHCHFRLRGSEDIFKTCAYDHFQSGFPPETGGRIRNREFHVSWRKWVVTPQCSRKYDHLIPRHRYVLVQQPEPRLNLYYNASGWAVPRVSIGEFKLEHRRLDRTGYVEVGNGYVGSGLRLADPPGNFCCFLSRLISKFGLLHTVCRGFGGSLRVASHVGGVISSPARMVQSSKYSKKPKECYDDTGEGGPEHRLRPRCHLFMSIQISSFAVLLISGFYLVFLSYKVADSGLDALERRRWIDGGFRLIFGVVLALIGSLCLPWFGYWLAFNGGFSHLLG